MMTKYLSGLVNNLLPSEANKRYPKNSYTIHRLQDNGTVNVYQLVDKPVQKDQVPFGLSEIPEHKIIEQDDMDAFRANPFYLATVTDADPDVANKVLQA